MEGQEQAENEASEGEERSGEERGGEEEEAPAFLSIREGPARHNRRARAGGRESIAAMAADAIARAESDMALATELMKNNTHHHHGNGTNGTHHGHGGQPAAPVVHWEEAQEVV
jgi:hypothetical protein